MYVFCSKIAKEGRAFCIPITGFLTNITDWEGWYQKGTADIQLNLFYDYQNNVKSYPEWQEWLRKHQREMQVIWGKYDPSFTVAGAERD
ncbi:hypothetical protein [Chitinophaga tropicalis]|uniref:hypothetical protein n=1 Tax=Chitinophaga tropicalis TaxID=2683588 RepID=UPI001E46111C|nr:hypothetical protein [Chitinophaga tropicalis]